MYIDIALFLGRQILYMYDTTETIPCIGDFSFSDFSAIAVFLSCNPPFLLCCVMWALYT